MVAKASWHVCVCAATSLVDKVFVASTVASAWRRTFIVAIIAVGTTWIAAGVVYCHHVGHVVVRSYVSMTSVRQPAITMATMRIPVFRTERVNCDGERWVVPSELAAVLSIRRRGRPFATVATHNGEHYENGNDQPGYNYASNAWNSSTNK